MLGTDHDHSSDVPTSGSREQVGMPEPQRRIVHVDLDAFYASVEQRDNPELRGKPVAVGGSRERGVVAAASYEARRFGVHSAMPSVTARRKCPELIFVKPRFDVYREISRQIREIFYEYTSLVEPLSLDEAYLDVTENLKGIPYATQVAREIRAQIWQETQLTASAGISFNKFLAKMASDQNKPNGQFVITPETDRHPSAETGDEGREVEGSPYPVDVHVANTGLDVVTPRPHVLVAERHTHDEILGASCDCGVTPLVEALPVELPGLVAALGIDEAGCERLEPLWQPALERVWRLEHVVVCGDDRVPHIPRLGIRQEQRAEIDVGDLRRGRHHVYVAHV